MSTWRFQISRSVEQLPLRLAASSHIALMRLFKRRILKSNHGIRTVRDSSRSLMACRRLILCQVPCQGPSCLKQKLSAPFKTELLETLDKTSKVEKVTQVASTARGLKNQRNGRIRVLTVNKIRSTYSIRPRV